MSPVLGRVVRCVLAIVLGVSELSAQPEPDDVRVSVDYVAPSECGSRGDLIERIVRRSDRVRVDAPASERRLRVEIASEGERFVVTLELDQPNGRRSSRTLRAATCDEALEAAALVAALSLDPTANTAPDNELLKEPSPAPASPPPSSSPRVVEAPRQQAEMTALRVSLSLQGQGIWGPAPDAMPGVGAAVALALERPSVFAPALRLSYAHYGRSGFSPETGMGEASFRLDQGTLELCPVRFGTGPFGLSPCLLASGGRLLVSGSDALEPERHSRPWWVLGGSLLAGWRPVKPLELSVGVAMGIPLIRDTFQFDPGAPGHVVHQVSGVTLSLGLGAGVTFP